jgi:hypothetical protein
MVCRFAYLRKYARYAVQLNLERKKVCYKMFKLFIAEYSNGLQKRNPGD